MTRRKNQPRAHIGDTVRLYGYPGLFVVEPYNGLVVHHDYLARSLADPRVAFGVSDASLVEVNGRPVPLLSAPIAPPADDYPHPPLFSYSDGPQSLGMSARSIWERTRQTA